MDKHNWQLSKSISSKGREEQITKWHAMCYWRGKSKNPAEKPFCNPPSWNDPLKNQLEYMNTKRPSKPNLPTVLEPSKLQLPTDFTESYLC